MQELTQDHQTHNSKNNQKPLILEFTGVTGVGKTTMIKSLTQLLLEQGFSVKDAYEFILMNYHLNFIKSNIIRSILIDLIAFFPFLTFTFTSQGWQLFKLGFTLIMRDADHWFIVPNLLRNFIKRIGVNYLLNKLTKKSANLKFNCDVIICDEGILQIAHNLFVHVHTPPNLQEIQQFRLLVPKPDLTIWLKADPQRSIDCTLKRGHPRVTQQLDVITKFVDHAYVTFNELYADESLSQLVFFNETKDFMNYNKLDLTEEFSSIINYLSAKIKEKNVNHS